MTRGLLMLVLGVAGLSACGGGDDAAGGDAATSGGSGAVSITSPAPPQATTELVAVGLSGDAFISPTRSQCCTGSATDTGVGVGWTNYTNGESGIATQAVSYCWFFRYFLCNHRWSALVPVNLGSNDISVTASDADGNFATARIAIMRNPDVTSPQVTGTSPTDLADAVPLDANLAATFSEPMNPASLSAATFIVRDSGANAMLGTVTYTTGNRTATFDPAGNLTSGSTYTARVTTGAADLAGNNGLAADFVWTFTTGSNIWQSASQFGTAFSFSPSVVWTGTEMIVWGNTNLGSVGAKYDPSADTWQPIQSAGAPSRRGGHLSVWTGTEMIVWGGLQQNPFAWVSDGARYNPVTNTWLPLPTADAPSPRIRPTVVWTGTEMIVWGGSDAAGSGYLADGARYDPLADRWTPMTPVNTPAGRVDHAAVWTGSEMIVWGGVNGAGWTNTGGRYDPALDAWQPTVATGAPQARSNHAAVWTGSRMIVWGGAAGTVGNPPLNTGGRYDPLMDSWQATATAGAPSARVGFSAVASASQMMVWGGANSSGLPVNTGAVYNPVTNQWSAITTTGAPSARSGHFAVWTGASMVVWGPLDGTGGRYTP